MSGPRVWVDENDLRLVIEMAVNDGEYHQDMEPLRAALRRVEAVLDPLPPPPLRPYRACTQGHGA